jgi:hypothetical protein
MLSIEARLSYSEQAKEFPAATGWYLACSEPVDWIAALREIGPQVRTTKFFLAPTSPSDLNASGLIAIVEQSETGTKTPLAAVIVPAGAIPLVRYSSSSKKQLLLPINTKLLPPSTTEIKTQLETLSCDVFVWLPQTSLIGLEPDDEIQPAFLIRPSSHSNRSIIWATPIIPPYIPDRLPQISLSSSSDLRQLFSQEREQIGGDAARLIEIDEQGEPQKKGVPQKLRDVARRVALKLIPKRQGNNQKSTSKSTSQASGNADTKSSSNSGSFLDNLSRYISNFFDDSLQQERDRQIEKLLRLLASNPDLALKYSIPMGANSEGGMARGISNPGAKLTERDVDFSLRNVNGGGAAVDPWSIRDDLRRQLAESYREQARREIAAGRHRRAAYIYAHLLGDLNYAAVILEQGKFYAEAAALYGGRLNRPRDQARCLVAAAQFEAAAKVYEEMNDYSAAGDLWAKIEIPHRANEAYEKAVEAALAKSNILDAAKLLDEKLKSRNRAEQLLWQQWPYGQRPLEAMILAFSWLVDKDRHAEAIERFQTSVDLASAPEHRLKLANLCVHLFHRFPLQALKQRAEDQCRMCLAANLDSTTKQEREERMTILRSLHPSDQALQRDARRYTDRSARIEPRPVTPPSIKPAALISLPSLSLPAAAYIDAVMIGTEVLAIGWRASQLIATRAPCNIESDFKPRHFPFAHTSQALAADVQLAYNQSHDAPRAFVSFFGVEVGFQPQSVTSSLSGIPWVLYESPYPQTLKIAFTPDQHMWALASDFKSISTYENGSPLTFDIDYAMRDPFEDATLSELEELPVARQVQLVCVGQFPFFSIGNLLFHLKNREVQLLNVSDSQINHISPSLPHSLARLLICTNNELCCWYADSQKMETLSSGKPYSEAIFLHGGRVAALTENTLELYERQQTGYRIHSATTLSTKAHCRLLPISVDAFGLLSLDGTIQRWKHR